MDFDQVARKRFASDELPCRTVHHAWLARATEHTVPVSWIEVYVCRFPTKAGICFVAGGVVVGNDAFRPGRKRANQQNASVEVPRPYILIDSASSSSETIDKSSLHRGMQSMTARLS